MVSADNILTTTSERGNPWTTLLEEGSFGIASRPFGKDRSRCLSASSAITRDLVALSVDPLTGNLINDYPVRPTLTGFPTGLSLFQRS